MRSMTAVNNVNGSIVRIPFRWLSAVGVTGAAFDLFAVDLAPSVLSTSRLASIATNFKWFRFTNLRFNVTATANGVSMVSTTNNVTSGGYVLALAMSTDGGSDTVATPTSFSQLAQLESFRYCGGNAAATPLNLRVGRGQLLKRSVKWWRTNNINSPPYDELVQGCVYFAIDPDSAWGGIAMSLVYVIEGVCEFTGTTVSTVELADPDPKKPIRIHRLGTPIAAKAASVISEDDEKFA